MFAEFLAASVLPIPVRGFNIEHLGSELLVVVATTIAGWYFRLIRGKSIGKQKLNCASCHNNPVIVAVKVRPRIRSLLMALVFLGAAATALLSLFREAGLAHTLWRDFAVWTSAHVGFDTEWFQVGSTALLALLALVIGLTGWKTHYECELSGEVAEHKGSGRFRHQGDEGRKGPSPAQVKELRLQELSAATAKLDTAFLAFKAAPSRSQSQAEMQRLVDEARRLREDVVEAMLADKTDKRQIRYIEMEERLKKILREKPDRYKRAYGKSE